MSKELSIKKLETIAVDALEDIKGRDIIVVNTTKLSQMFERIVLASGESNRQVRSLARHVADKVREAGGEVLSTEGEETGEWVLVDLGPVVVHIMQPTVRAHFDLEGLWGPGKPAGHAAEKAAMKAAAKKAVTKASEASSEDGVKDKPPAKKPSARQPAASKTTAEKPAAKKAAPRKAPAKKPAAAKPRAKKPAAE
ncbi:ribosomal silencing factor RsfS [Fluviibacter phosphoraccumulans]|uniref:Ribosomal silencing factor RsfS n=1 Tax=Fluviibacter phosphoraccumulans TaxID=1751046 RepID=A0A679IDQ8_9RHOO|nr:ribosomal silencing factor RsfS [Fluviibacter phosphoraccumulans]BBU72416.1 ribosomal silencing factor RsfS [Fluviibacter phosphoraccumulans]BCA66612.1 ribosomal silencing factor RsfS [Fluviibacter phosphoraccumulans]